MEEKLEKNTCLLKDYTYQKPRSVASNEKKKLGKNFETKLTFTVTNLHLDAGISHGSFLSAETRKGTSMIGQKSLTAAPSNPHLPTAGA